MADLILPPTSWRSLPPDRSMFWGEVVRAPALHQLGQAGVHLLGERGRHVLHHEVTPWSALSGTVPPETVTAAWRSRFHANHVAVLVRYLGLDTSKSTRQLEVRLCPKARGGAVGEKLDFLVFDFDRGSLHAGWEVDDERPGGKRWTPFEAWSGTTPRDGAGAYVPRPLAVGGASPAELAIKVSASENVRILTIDAWELFEEAIEQ